MADYQLIGPDINGVENIFRTTDGAFIPNTPLNRDWIEYQEWLAAGGVPDPAPEPEAKPNPEPNPVNAILYDHENRIRVQEGREPLAPADFAKMLG